jgi:arginine repressor
MKLLDYQKIKVKLKIQKCLGESEMRMVTISEILNKGQIAGLEKLIRLMKKEKIDVMSPEFSKRLKEYLGAFKEELLKKEIDSNYLAYAIVYQESMKPKE